MPSPAMIVAIIALLVGLGGGAYAAKVKLSKNAVTTKSIKNKAVTEKKLADGAVSDAKLASSVRGAAVAWADVAANGSVNAGRGISASNITPHGTGFYCFHDLPEFGTASVTPGFSDDEFGSFLIATLSKPAVSDIGCPSGTQFAVATQFFNIVSDNAPYTNEPFSVVLVK